MENQTVRPGKIQTAPDTEVPLGVVERYASAHLPLARSVASSWVDSPSSSGH